MTGPLRDRATFLALRSRGSRRRRGCLSASYLPGPPEAGTRVGYAVPRRVGGAVVRNRVRRRLRHAVAELDRQPGRLPPGAVLVVAHAGVPDVAFEELLITVGDLLDAVRTGAEGARP